MNSDKIKMLLTIGTEAEDIVHGKCKILLVEAEDRKQEATTSAEYSYWEGYGEAVAELYKLTYNISFARKDLENNNV